jgi:hypothetical protein
MGTLMAERPIPVARAEVNLRGDWTRYSEPHVETALPLILPGGNPPAPRPVALPPPPPPSEAELRERLATALERKRTADAKLAAAEAAHDRALQRAEHCKATLEGFADLDDAITAHTVEALRCDAGRLDPAMTEEMELLLADRTTAQVSLTTANRATAILSEELTDARAAATHVTRAAREAGLAVLAVEAMRLVQRHEELVAETERKRLSLHSFARIATRETLPVAVLTLLRSHDLPMTALAKMNVSEWQAALDALLADPMTEIEVA